PIVIFIHGLEDLFLACLHARITEFLEVFMAIFFRSLGDFLGRRLMGRQQELVGRQGIAVLADKPLKDFLPPGGGFVGRHEPASLRVGGSKHLEYTSPCPMSCSGTCSWALTFAFCRAMLLGQV